jgi:PAS domain S-box-containing protein
LSPDVVYVYDVVNKKNIYSNNGIQKVLGYSVKEIQNMGNRMISILMHPDDLKVYIKETIQKYGQAKGNEIISSEYRMKHKNGTWIWLECKELIYKRQNSGLPWQIFGVIHNINERKKVEDEKIENANRFKKLSANVPGLIYQFTKKTDGTYCVPIASEGIKDIFGCSPEDVVSDFSPIGKVIFPEDLERVTRDIEYSTKNLSFFTCEFRVQIPGKPIQWVYSRSKPEKLADGSVTWYGFNTDITAQKKVEELLLENEKRLTEAQRMALVGNWELDLVTNKLTWSDEIYKIFEIDKKRFGASYEAFLNAIHPEDRSMVDAVYTKSVESRKPYKVSHRLLMSDGRIKYVDEQSETFYGRDGKPIHSAGTVQDVTERRKTELAMEKEQVLSKTIIDSIPGTFYMLDEKGFYVRWNSYQRDEIVGKPDDQVSTVNAIDTIHPDDRALIGSRIANVLMKGGSKTVMGRVLMRGGPSYKWLLMTGRRMIIDNKPFLLGIGIDITERKEMEEKILELKDQGEAILHSIGDAVFACNKDGKILVFNKVAEEMTGVKTADAIGKHYREIISFVRESDGKPSDEFIVEAIEKNKITKMANHVQLVSKDGKKIPVADSAAPITNTSGQIIGCVVVFHDVAREREIDKAKTEFVSLASHQLRTPLTTLRWSSEMLSSGQDGKLNAKQQHLTDHIQFASKRMVALVNALLNVSRLELGTFKVEPNTIDVKEVVAASIKEFTSQIAKKKIIFQEKYDKNIPLIYTDPKLLNIVLDNILSNAIKYTPSGGCVELRVARDNNDILITVKDTGIGIPTLDKSKIFTKLFRSDNAKIIDPDGTGLGLYIVKEIIDHVGGTVWYESKEGEGTVFYLKLPIKGIARESKEQLI